MSTMPGFDSAQRQHEAMVPPDDPDVCDWGDCDECANCVQNRRESEADDYADMQREESRLESRYGG